MDIVKEYTMEKINKIYDRDNNMHNDNMYGSRNDS